MAERKPCARCGKPAPAGFRYCSDCQRVIRCEMRQANYLTPRPRKSRHRGYEAREDRHETKYGVG